MAQRYNRVLRGQRLVASVARAIGRPVLSWRTWATVAWGCGPGATTGLPVPAGALVLLSILASPWNQISIGLPGAVRRDLHAATMPLADRTAWLFCPFA